MPFLKINGRKIYYEDHGEGAPIVLLHHGFGCTKIWKEIYPALLNKGYRVIMYDRRGFGRSEKGDDALDFYISDQVRGESVKELATLLKTLHVESLHLVGQCEGGVLAVDFATAYPEQVQTITISSTQCYSVVTMEELNQDKFPRPFQDLDPGLREKLKDWHGEEYAESFFNQFRTYGGEYGKDFFDIRPLLPDITCPFLVLYPDRSFIFEVEQGVAYYRHLPKGELAVLPACGHNTYEYYPEAYARHVLQFLERNGFGS
ncbi:MAG: alpha/beta fold hydrolase [Desulfatiglandales bacterium]